MTINKEKSILVVDDYQTMRGVVRNLFNQLGFIKVLEAGTTDQALAALNNEKPELVVFDWHTGPMDGAEFFKKVRGDENLKDVPFVVISAESGGGLTDDMKNAGVSDFIAKPFTNATLRQKMEALFGSF